MVSFFPFILFPNQKYKSKRVRNVLTVGLFALKQHHHYKYVHQVLEGAPNSTWCPATPLSFRSKVDNEVQPNFHLNKPSSELD